MSNPAKGSGHGPPPPRKKYSDVHIKVLVVCAVKKKTVEEYWWSVTPAVARLESPTVGFKTGKVFWQLQAYDLKDGSPLDRKIDHISMEAGWEASWGKPERVTDHQWKLDANVPTVETEQAHPYTIYTTIAGCSITIDPEVDFDP